MSNFEKASSQISEIANHPDLNVMANRLSQSVQGMEGVAPNISQSLQTTGTKAIQYLNAKMPKPVSELAGDPQFKASKSEQRKWMESHGVVNDPVSALDHLRHGTLTQNHMEALAQVHPELLDEMRQKVMEHMDPKRLNKIPSSTKAALGLFLGSPISQASTPRAIQANQAIFQMSAPQAPQGKGSKSTLGGLRSLKIGERAASETTNLENSEK